MDKKKIIDIVENIQDRPNNDLFLVQKELFDEFNKTKELIIDLTRHLDSVEELYNKVNDEIGKRTKK